MFWLTSRYKERGGGILFKLYTYLCLCKPFYLTLLNQESALKEKHSKLNYFRSRDKYVMSDWEDTIINIINQSQQE